MTEAAALLPIVIDYAHLECGGWCFNACSDLLDAASGKTRHHLQLVLDEAIKKGFEDLVLLLPNALPKIKTQAEKICKRKRNLQQLRITHFDIPSNVGKHQADRLRLLYERHASLVAKGFVYINGHCLPVSDLKSFVLDFKKVAKKNASLAIRILATKCSSEPDSAFGHVVAYGKKSSDLIGFSVFDRLRAQKFDLAEFCQENRRLLNITESTGEITTKLQLNFDHFVCNSKLLEGLNSNIDFETVQSFIMDGLAKPVDLDTCQILMADKLSTTQNSRVQNLRQIRLLLTKDSQAASDAIELEGNKSYWKRFESDSVVHESVDVPKKLRLQNVVLMKDVVIGHAVENLSDCVIGTGARIQADCTRSYVSPDSHIDQPVDMSLILPKSLISALQPMDPLYFESGAVPYGKAEHNLMQIQCTPRWFEAELSLKPTFLALERDPTNDRDEFFDELFDLNEREENVSAEAQSSNEINEDFKEDVMDLLESGEEGHMQDLLLELRTLRLSENKKDIDLMRAFAEHVCELAQKSCGFKSADKISEFLRERELYSIIDAFCSDQDSRFGFYQGVTEYLAKLSEADQSVKASIFIAVISSLEEILLNEDHLPAFLEKPSTLHNFQESALIQQYLAWLREDDDSDDSTSQ